MFRSRAALIEGLAARIYQRLTPPDDYLDEQASAPPSRDQWVRLMVDLLERARAQPELHLALLELRLEATRRPELRQPLTDVVRRSLESDIGFHERSGLLGGEEEIVLMHLAIGGLITELLTLPDALGVADPQPVVERLVDRLIFAAG